MPRPRKHRRCRRYQADRIYKPQGIPMTEIGNVEVTPDQFEAMRLCDVDGLDQGAAGKRMGVSRGTIQRLLYEGRRRLLEAVIRQDAIVINLKHGEV